MDDFETRDTFPFEEARIPREKSLPRLTVPFEVQPRALPPVRDTQETPMVVAPYNSYQEAFDKFLARRIANAFRSGGVAPVGDLLEFIAAQFDDEKYINLWRKEIELGGVDDQISALQEERRALLARVAAIDEKLQEFSGGQKTLNVERSAMVDEIRLKEKLIVDFVGALQGSIEAMVHFIANTDFSNATEDYSGVLIRYTDEDSEPLELSFIWENIGPFDEGEAFGSSDLRKNFNQQFLRGVVSRVFAAEGRDPSQLFAHFNEALRARRMPDYVARKIAFTTIEVPRA